MTDALQAVLLGVAAAHVVAAAPVLYRLVVGPTNYDRIVAGNAIGTTTVTVIVLLAAGLDDPSLLDVALVYALLNFVFSVGVARFSLARGEPS